MIDDKATLEKKKLVKKWIPVLKQAKIPKKHYTKVAEYAENHLTSESSVNHTLFGSPGRNVLSPSTLAPSLKVLAYLDLSKVDFMSAPVGVLNEGEENEEFLQCGTFQVTIDSNVGSDQDLLLMGLDEMHKIELDAISELAESIGKNLKENKQIIFYQVVSDIVRVEGTNKFAARSRYSIIKNK